MEDFHNDDFLSQSNDANKEEIDTATVASFSSTSSAAVENNPLGNRNGPTTGSTKPLENGHNESWRNDINKLKFPQSKPKPAKARMFMGRELPPAIMEYDNDHHDAEFGSVKPGEYGYLEFHDGMLEELEIGDKGNNIQTETMEFEQNTKYSLGPGKNETIKINSFDFDSASKDTEKLNLEPEEKTTSMLPQMKPPLRPSASSSRLSQETITILKSSANGIGEQNREYSIQQQLEHLQSEIYKLNGEKEFNINSPKQVSMVLFGVENESTSKVALEALAGNISNSGGKAQIASLILKYRKYSRDLKRIEKGNEYRENGTLVKSIESMRGGKEKGLEQKVIPSSIVSPIPSISSSVEREPLVLIDASAYIFRAYYMNDVEHTNSSICVYAHKYF
jgi:hypothetical protein